MPHGAARGALLRRRHMGHEHRHQGAAGLVPAIDHPLLLRGLPGLDCPARCGAVHGDALPLAAGSVAGCAPGRGGAGDRPLPHGGVRLGLLQSRHVGYAVGHRGPPGLVPDAGLALDVRGDPARPRCQGRGLPRAAMPRGAKPLPPDAGRVNERGVQLLDPRAGGRRAGHLGLVGLDAGRVLREDARCAAARRVAKGPLRCLGGSAGDEGSKLVLGRLQGVGLPPKVVGPTHLGRDAAPRRPEQRHDPARVPAAARPGALRPH
mmetsp:Transcript_933/g.2982  ORF Transcript_933/g.2982 Transcript_933/m.2982 type:complete len:263 (+) Transcript_933:418-1206(+)